MLAMGSYPDGVKAFCDCNDRKQEIQVCEGSSIWSQTAVGKLREVLLPLEKTDRENHNRDSGCKGPAMGLGQKAELWFYISRQQHCFEILCDSNRSGTMLSCCAFDSTDCSPAGSCPQDFLCNNTGVGCHFLLQGMDLPEPVIQPVSPALSGELLTDEPLSVVWQKKNCRLFFLKNNVNYLNV